MRTLVIGDIHGCLTALDALLAAVAPQADDRIVALGDYVDRGPNSRGVIERLLELGRQHKLVSLRGNHEWMMLEAREGDFDFWWSFGGQETLESYRVFGREDWAEKIPYEHWRFIERTCVDYYETETHVFTHAGLNPHVPLAEQDNYSLCWQKLDPFAPPHVSGKTVICGHTAQPSGQPRNLGHTVCIDTWVYGEGWLTCLEVETGRYWQADEQGQRREGKL
jgi:serine/threonine protein phosphatase 1